MIYAVETIFDTGSATRRCSTNIQFLPGKISPILNSSLFFCCQDGFSSRAGAGLSFEKCEPGWLKVHHEALHCVLVKKIICEPCDLRIAADKSEKCALVACIPQFLGNVP